jgi:hypothetical protein
MSFAVDREGRVFFLDQIHARVVVLARGEAPVVIPLPTNTYQEIALDPRGGLVLLDRLVSRAVLFLSDRGEARHQIPLEGPRVREGGLVTALFAREDGVWVEVEHTSLVRVALPDGSPDPARPTRPGRFSTRKGKYLRAALVEGRFAEVHEVARKGERRPLARIELASDVLQLCALETDAQGRIFVGASLFREEANPDDTRGLGDQVIGLSPEGHELWRVLFPPNTGPEEQFRKIRVGGDGAIYHLALSDEGATLRRYVP